MVRTHLKINKNYNNGIQRKLVANSAYFTYTVANSANYTNETCYNLNMLNNNESNSLKILVSNLNNLMLQSLQTPNYECLASKIAVNLSTLKGWMSQQRTPTLKTIDKIANLLGCHTFQMLKPDGQMENIGIADNDSATAFLQNLQAIFNEKKKFSLIEKCSLVNDAYNDGDKYITETMLISYLRKNSRRIPSLRVIDYIAKSLKMESYKLLIPKII